MPLQSNKPLKSFYLFRIILTCIYVHWRNGGPASEKQPRSGHQIYTLNPSNSAAVMLPELFLALSQHFWCTGNSALERLGLGCGVLTLVCVSVVVVALRRRLCCHLCCLSLPMGVVFFMYLAASAHSCLKHFQDSWLLLGDK